MADQWVLEALSGILPEETVRLLNEHVLHPATPFQTVRREVVLRIRQGQQALRPLLLPLLQRAAAALQNSPDTVVLVAALAIVVFVLQLLALVRRIMMWWTRLAMRLIFWSLVAAAVAVVWQRGPEVFLRDLVVFFSKLWGYASVVKAIWLSEYNRWDEKTRNGRSASGNARGRKY